MITLAILQARVSSSRLPGKVLRPVLGQPLLLHQINRLRKARFIDHLLVATSTDSSDDVLADLCEKNNVDCFRGSLVDVLDRFYSAAQLYRPSSVVRLTGDCPLADPELIDQAISIFKEGNFDYMSNTLEPSFPDGLDVEVFKYSVLERVWREAKLNSQREHVTPYIYQNPGMFKIGNFKGNVDLSNLRWTVDELVDFDLVEIIYENLFPQNNFFTTKDILSFLDKNPNLKKMNAQYKRNEGLTRSIEKDRV